VDFGIVQDGHFCIILSHTPETLKIIGSYVQHATKDSIIRAELLFNARKNRSLAPRVIDD
jgi:hypothetical protein